MFHSQLIWILLASLFHKSSSYKYIHLLYIRKTKQKSEILNTKKIQRNKLRNATLLNRKKYLVMYYATPKADTNQDIQNSFSKKKKESTRRGIKM